MRKLENKKGFTLAELLIVVAIIAVLVAVAIPVFTAQLEKARQATDVANLRSAYAEAVAGYLGTGAAAESPEYTVQHTATGFDPSAIAGLPAELDSTEIGKVNGKGKKFKVTVADSTDASKEVDVTVSVTN